MSQSEIALLIQSVECCNQGRRNGCDSEHQQCCGSGKELVGRQQPSCQKPKKSANRVQSFHKESGAPEKVLQTVASIPKVVVRLLMLFPFKRSNQQQTAA